MNRELSKDLMKRWRRQIMGFHAKKPHRAPRPVGAMGYMIDGQNSGQYVRIDRLTIVLVHDESFDRGTTAVRVAGFGVSRIPHGVQWGGNENARFFKDLCLPPADGTSGLRMNRQRPELLDLALQLERRIHEGSCFGRQRYYKLFRLPRLWAGFRHADAAKLSGTGPEFESLRAKFGFNPETLFRKFERSHQGLALYPLDWVSDQLAASLFVFAELAGFPASQVFRIGEFPDDLIGYDGAACWDFHHSRFRSWLESRFTESMSPAIAEPCTA